MYVSKFGKIDRWSGGKRNTFAWNVCGYLSLISKLETIDGLVSWKNTKLTLKNENALIDVM
jgi:hypothetical protein